MQELDEGINDQQTQDVDSSEEGGCEVETSQPNDDIESVRQAEQVMEEEDREETKKGGNIHNDQKGHGLWAGSGSATTLEFKRRREEMRGLLREREQMEAALDGT